MRQPKCFISGAVPDEGRAANGARALDIHTGSRDMLQMFSNNGYPTPQAPRSAPSHLTLDHSTPLPADRRVPNCSALGHSPRLRCPQTHGNTEQICSAHNFLHLSLTPVEACPRVVCNDVALALPPEAKPTESKAMQSLLARSPSTNQRHTTGFIPRQNFVSLALHDLPHLQAMCRLDALPCSVNCLATRSNGSATNSTLSS